MAIEAERRRVAAFLRWSLVRKENGKLKLDDRGWCLARGRTSLERVLLEIIDHETPYRSALEWIYHQKMDSVLGTDVSSHWYQHYPDDVGTEHEGTMAEQSICFLRLAAAAGLGKLLLGRKGASTRLELNRLTLSQFIEAGTAATSPKSPPAVDSETDDRPGEKHEAPTAGPTVLSMPPVSFAQTGRPRVFIAHGKNRKLVKQVEDILTQVAGFECEVAIKDEETAIPLPEKVSGAMKRCSAIVIVVSKEAMLADPNSHRVNENVLIEIGAAFALHDRRVVLLWVKRVPVPSNIEGLYRCEFDGADLDLPAVIKLMKALRRFTDEMDQGRRAG